MSARHTVALAALLALVTALSGCGAKDLSPAAIAQAADATVAERGMRIALKQTLTMPGAGRVETSGSGVMDTAGQASHLTLKVTRAPDVVVGAFDTRDLTIEVITDHAAVYTHSAQLNQLLGAGRRWVRIDAVEMGRAAGIDIAALPQTGQDPAQAMRQLRAVSGKVETVGREEVRGVATTHYRTTIDLRRYPALAPAADRAAARAAIDRLVAQIGVSEIPVDVWIGEDDLVRRLRQKLPLQVAGGPIAIEQRFEFYDFGTAVRVEIPSPREVTDVTDLAASGAATICP
jgi:hypothetical protein